MLQDPFPIDPSHLHLLDFKILILIIPNLNLILNLNHHHLNQIPLLPDLPSSIPLDGKQQWEPVLVFFS